MSLIRRHSAPRTPPPHIATTLIKKIIFIVLINILKRKIPYPPNFNKTPAKIIDPATGASTCAFGSQRWTKYIGNLMTKAITAIIVYKNHEDAIWPKIKNLKDKNLNPNLKALKINNTTSRGKDPNSV